MISVAPTLTRKNNALLTVDEYDSLVLSPLVNHGAPPGNKNSMYFMIPHRIN